MATLIYNYNDHVRWDKTDCHDYTITNLSVLYNVHVDITDETGDWTESFELEPGASNTITVPGDGVFKICSYQYDVPLNVEQLTNVNGYLSINGYPANAADLDMILVDFTVSTDGIQTTITESGDFSNPPSSLQAFLDAIQDYLDANGGGTVTLLLPGESIPNVVAAENSIRIVVQSTTTQLISTSYENGGDPVVNDSNLLCTYSYVFTENNRYMFSLIVNGTEIVPTNSFYNMSVQADVDTVVSQVNTLLGANGTCTGTLYNLFINIVSDIGLPCTAVTANAGDLGPGESVCDYIYEFCDLYACLSRLMNRWMCQDPCADKCTQAYETYEEARRKAIELSTMFFHALMPLVAQDRLWYFGNWSITDQRICNVNNILELYSKMRDYVSNCGFDCGCGCTDPCDPCDPCSGNSYQPSLSNPSTPCGCK
jgi:hypothetical protein